MVSRVREPPKPEKRRRTKNKNTPGRVVSSPLAAIASFSRSSSSRGGGAMEHRPRARRWPQPSHRRNFGDEGAGILKLPASKWVLATQTTRGKNLFVVGQFEGWEINHTCGLQSPISCRTAKCFWFKAIWNSSPSSPFREPSQLLRSSGPRMWSPAKRGMRASHPGSGRGAEAWLEADSQIRGQISSCTK